MKMFSYKYLADRFKDLKQPEPYWDASFKAQYTQILYDFAVMDMQLDDSDMRTLSNVLLSEEQAPKTAQFYLAQFQARSDFSGLNRLLIQHLNQGATFEAAVSNILSISNLTQQINLLFDNPRFISVALGLKEKSYENLKHLIDLIREGVNYERQAFAVKPDTYAAPEELVTFLKSDAINFFEIDEEEGGISSTSTTAVENSQEQKTINLEMRAQLNLLSEKLGLKVVGENPFKSKNYSSKDKENFLRITESSNAMHALKLMIEFLDNKKLLPRFDSLPPLVFVLGLGDYENLWVDMTEQRAKDFSKELESVWPKVSKVFGNQSGSDFVKAFRKMFMRLLVIPVNSQP